MLTSSYVMVDTRQSFKISSVICVSTLLFLWPHQARSHLHAKRLYDRLLRGSGYNNIIRPVANGTEKITVNIGLQLMQIIDVDERNQVMTTNVWLIQEWTDPTLVWNAEKYGGVDMLYVPAVSIWHPDIVLYNTADGTYEMTKGTKATVYSNGRVQWRAPASFKSSCSIDVTYFPFDEQSCTMKFGSWTYNKDEVDIRHMWQHDKGKNEYDLLEKGIDLVDFYRNVEWDLMSTPAQKATHHYAGSDEVFTMWTFGVTLRRKFLFYTVNLIVPLVSHAAVTPLVFHLPGDSRQKIALCINILLSLTVFFLMLAEIIPPTSLVVPLLGKYLVFTLFLVAISVTMTVFTYNVHYRSIATHSMPDWARKIFLYILPRLLRMRRPKVENSQDVQLKYIKLRMCTSCFGCKRKNSQENERYRPDTASKYTFGSKRTKTQLELINLSKELDEHTLTSTLEDHYSPEVQSAIEGVTFIANQMKQEDEFNRVKEDWKYVALVLDRIFLIIYTIVCVVGTIGIICQAPMLYDSRVPLQAGLA